MAQPAAKRAASAGEVARVSGMAEASTSLADKVAVAALELKAQGYAVVEGVYTDAECARNKRAMWDWTSKTTQGRVKELDRNTCTGVKWPPHTHYIIQHLGVGHQQAAWNARTNKKAIEAFARLWGTDKLTSSFDGANLWPAPEGVNGTRWPVDSTWMHVDQSPYNSDTECVQAWGTFEDVDGEWDATLMVVPGSHLLHKDLLKVNGCAPVHKATGKPDNNDWYKFTPEELNAILGKDWKTKKAVRVSAPKGSMVFWDSRTFHQGCAPVEGRPVKRDRAIVYLCYGPVKWMTEVQKKKKRDAATNERTTTHWPLKSKLFAPTPRTYGRILPAYDVQTGGRDDNDPTVRKLCCFDAYGSTGLLGWTKEKTPLLDFKQRK